MTLWNVIKHSVGRQSSFAIGESIMTGDRMLRPTGYGTLAADRVFPQLEKALWWATEYSLLPDRAFWRATECLLSSENDHSWPRLAMPRLYRASWRPSECFRSWIEYYVARQSTCSYRIKHRDCRHSIPAIGLSTLSADRMPDANENWRENTNYCELPCIIICSANPKTYFQSWYVPPRFIDVQHSAGNGTPVFVGEQQKKGNCVSMFVGELHSAANRVSTFTDAQHSEVNCASMFTDRHYSPVNCTSTFVDEQYSARNCTSTFVDEQ